MNGKMAAIIVALVVSTQPAPAHPSTSRRPSAAAAAVHKAAGKRAAARNASSRKDVLAHRRKSKSRKSPADDAAQVAGTYAAMSEAQRLAIQSDLAWVGEYTGAPGADFDESFVAAVKAFQKRNHGKETGILSAEERDRLAAAAKKNAHAVGWRLIEDPATGARLGLPEKLAPRAGASRTGSRWTSAQGQIEIETFRFPEAALPALFEEEKKTAGRQVVFDLLRAHSFVLSGVQGLKNFVVRAEANGSELRGVTVLYDRATEGLMGPVAIAIADSFAGFPDPNAAAPPGLRRAVDYGTAIVVGRDGDLITAAGVTDGCQAITVPGLGHAQRIAADNDIALLRLYGARNLVPAAFADISRRGAEGGDLTLIGVADPFSQGGGDAVTRLVARHAAENIEPAPKRGFSGAAALDAQDRLVGTVDLKKPVAAGGDDSPGAHAALVPVEVIRAFLHAYGIASAVASGHPAIEQSIMRVICVRN